MIISCPACESRFKVEPGRVPAGGRRVRCGKCGHVWLVAADGAPVSAVDDSLPAAESEDAGGSALFVRDSTPVTDNRREGEDVPPPPVDSGADEGRAPAAGRVPGHVAGGAEDTDFGLGAPAGAERSGSAEAAVGTGETASPAIPPPPVLGPAVTPSARQKLAQARKGKSRVRFLVVALLLTIMVAVAISYIKGPVGLNDALRMVPGPSLDNGGASETDVDENAGDDAR